MPAVPRIELKTNSYPMQKWCLAQGLGVITEGLNEYEIYKNELKIALHRGSARISEPKNKARFVPAGPPIETPELQCLGPKEVRFGCALSVDIPEIERLSENFYGSIVPISLKFLSSNEESAKSEKFAAYKKKFEKKFLNLPENLRFYGLKPDENTGSSNGNKVFGVFYNTGDKNITFKKKTIPPKTITFIELESGTI